MKKNPLINLYSELAINKYFAKDYLLQKFFNFSYSDIEYLKNLEKSEKRNKIIDEILNDNIISYDLVAYPSFNGSKISREQELNELRKLEILEKIKKRNIFIDKIIKED